MIGVLSLLSFNSSGLGNLPKLPSIKSSNRLIPWVGWLFASRKLGFSYRWLQSNLHYFLVCAIRILDTHLPIECDWFVISESLHTSHFSDGRMGLTWRP